MTFPNFYWSCQARVCVCACTKTSGKEKWRITATGQFLEIPQNNPRALWVEFWGIKVQPIALHPTKLPASITEFKLKQHSQPDLYSFVMWVIGLKWLLTHCCQATQKHVIALQNVVDGSRLSTFFLHHVLHICLTSGLAHLLLQVYWQPDAGCFGLKLQINRPIMTPYF